MIVGEGGLTLSEAINTMAALLRAISGKPGGDAVLSSAHAKITAAAKAYSSTHVEELEAVEAEIKMNVDWYD